MPRKRSTTAASAAAETPAKAEASAPVAPKTERLTSFTSHGLKYFRLTVPRDFGESYANDMNRWDVQVKDDGTIIAKPVRELVRN
jgi:hypothetical protein